MGSRPVLLESRIIQQTEQKVVTKWRRARARSHHESVACERLLAAAALGAPLATPAGRTGGCCAYTEATGRPGRVHTVALPVRKLSDHGQLLEVAPCTHSQSRRNLLCA